MFCAPGNLGGGWAGSRGARKPGRGRSLALKMGASGEGAWVGLRRTAGELVPFVQGSAAELRWRRRGEGEAGTGKLELYEAGQGALLRGPGRVEVEGPVAVAPRPGQPQGPGQLHFRCLIDDAFFRRFGREAGSYEAADGAVAGAANVGKVGSRLAPTPQTLVLFRSTPLRLQGPAEEQLCTLTLEDGAGVAGGAGEGEGGAPAGAPELEAVAGGGGGGGREGALEVAAGYRARLPT